MIVTTRFPDPPPQPETAANAAFRRRFFARWGQENSVFLASTRAAEYGPLPTALSFKAVLDGQVAVRLGRRRLVMGPGEFLLVNPGQTYGFSIRSDVPVRCFSVQVRDDLARELAAEACQGLDDALVGPRPGAGVEVAERLAELRAPLRGALARLVQQVQQGAMLADIEAGFIELVGSALRQDGAARAHALRSLDAVRPATRAELARRVGWAADFLRSHHGQAIGLAEVAAAAHLSRFHLLRAFRQVHRCTPQQFLQQLRLRSALRLLDDPALDLQTVAARSGFGSRWTLQRALRSRLATTGQAWRARAPA